MNSPESGDRTERIEISGIQLAWDLQRGVCTFNGMPVAMMWLDSTLRAAVQALQAMVGTPRLLLALQGEGRLSVDDSWKVISQYPDFRQGFMAVANLAAVAGWGRWELVRYDPGNRECRFRATDTWEGLSQRSMGACWGSALLAGMLAGYCSKHFGVKCWADQTAFIADGAEYDEFLVRPSSPEIETELENVMAAHDAAHADMAVALARLRKEFAERQRTEEALRQANQQLQLLAANLHEAVLAYDMDRRLVFANSAVEKLTGYSIEDLRREHFICWISPVDQERMLAYWDKLFQGESYAEVEYRLVTRQGEKKWVAASWGPLLDGSGRQVGVQGSERDITDRKRVEAERARLLERLRQSQKLESLGRLAGGVAHDFNNWLTVINGFSRMLLDQVGQNDPLRDKLEQIHTSGERAAELTRQLLAFSSRQVVEPKPVSLNRLIDESRGMLGQLAGGAIEIGAELSAAPDEVMADPGRLHQVLMNLVANARDAMPAGGRLEISTATAELDAEAASVARVSPGPFVVLTVSDSGAGMSEEVRARIFEPFFTTKGQGKGTGLGLATVYGIVRQAGGWVEVRSAPGAGTTFRIGLPPRVAPGPC